MKLRALLLAACLLALPGWAAGSLDALAGRFDNLSSALPAALGRKSALLREAAGDARGGGPDRGASPR